MILPTGRLQVRYSDPQVNQELRVESASSAAFTTHFSQNEELFIRLPQPVEVGSYPVHHDLGESEPDPDLAGAVRAVAAQVHELDGNVLGGLTHLFDPAAGSRPGFFRLYRLRETTYLCLLRIDLTYRPRRSELIARTTNVRTAHYRTTDVFVESDLFPLVSVDTEGDRIRNMQVEQSISDTWIGETGRGYMRAGMWLDRDLTKFFSRLFVPDSVQTYPYFPFTCKYRAVAHTVPGFTDEARKRSVQLLDRARSFLVPNLREIEDSLREVRQNAFTEELPMFARLRRSVGEEWRKPWERFSMRMYLNEEDEREFELEHGLF